jgi:hypothetical protein
MSDVPLAPSVEVLRELVTQPVPPGVDHVSAVWAAARMLQMLRAAGLLQEEADHA